MVFIHIFSCGIFVGPLVRHTTCLRCFVGVDGHLGANQLAWVNGFVTTQKMNDIDNPKDECLKLKCKQYALTEH